MRTITVNKAELIEKIKENRDRHREQFLVAQERYREKWIEILDKRLADARADKKIDQYIRLPEPEDHTRDYDTALAMLEWELGEEIELGHDDFQRYVENRWEWAHSFAANTQSYLAQ